MIIGPYNTMFVEFMQVVEKKGNSLKLITAGAVTTPKDMLMSERLKTLNASIASAFVKKTGKSEAEILEMMDRETWLTANQAKEAGIVDAIIGQSAEPAGKYRNALFGCSVTPEMIEQAKAAKAEEEKTAQDRARAAEALTSDLELFGI